jgi:positive regulator of sigma E activity
VLLLLLLLGIPAVVAIHVAGISNLKASLLVYLLLQLLVSFLLLAFLLFLAFLPLQGFLLMLWFLTF